MNIRTIYRQSSLRQRVYEHRYARMFLAVLDRQYKRAAKDYENGEGWEHNIQPEQLEGVYRRLYSYCMVKEAEISHEMYIEPLAKENKAFFDDVLGVLSNGLSKLDLIKLWRKMAHDYVTVEIMTRLNEVTETTRKQIRKIIEKGLEEGHGADVVAKNIRNESKGEINKNRSKLIARTETVNAAGQGRRMVIISSNLLFDKKWSAADDDRTRLPHKHMNLETWQPFEQPYFVNGEYLDYPGDPKGSAGNVIQCRCAESYQVRRDASGRPMRKS